jgi:L-ascorbate metabolism protein UlaG (beta-lactamase superfamily)
MTSSDTKITWLGHATFLIETPADNRVLIDPWLEGNPSCPEEYQNVDSEGMLITHGHPDHVGNVFEAAENCEGPIVGIFEIATWLEQNGVDGDRLFGMNKGGTLDVDGLDIEVTMVDAHHSSSFVDDDGLVYLGEPAGYVLHVGDGDSIYVAGDTCLFSDMELIRDLYEPDVAVLPIGDRFTMDPEAAARACEFLEVDTAIPCHWGTFPPLTGTPEEFEQEVEELGVGTNVETLQPGDSW